jgi:hypothetical protein
MVYPNKKRGNRRGRKRGRRGRRNTASPLSADTAGSSGIESLEECTDPATARTEASKDLPGAGEVEASPPDKAILDLCSTSPDAACTNAEAHLSSTTDTGHENCGGHDVGFVAKSLVEKALPLSTLFALPSWCEPTLSREVLAPWVPIAVAAGSEEDDSLQDDGLQDDDGNQGGLGVHTEETFAMNISSEDFSSTCSSIEMDMVESKLGQAAASGDYITDCKSEAEGAEYESFVVLETDVEVSRGRKETEKFFATEEETEMCRLVLERVSNKFEPDDVPRGQVAGFEANPLTTPVLEVIEASLNVPVMSKEPCKVPEAIGTTLKVWKAKEAPLNLPVGEEAQINAKAVEAVLNVPEVTEVMREPFFVRDMMGAPLKAPAEEVLRKALAVIEAPLKDPEIVEEQSRSPEIIPTPLKIPAVIEASLDVPAVTELPTEAPPVEIPAARQRTDDDLFLRPNGVHPAAVVANGVFGNLNGVLPKTAHRTDSGGRTECQEGRRVYRQQWRQPPDFFHYDMKQIQEAERKYFTLKVFFL